MLRSFCATPASVVSTESHNSMASSKWLRPRSIFGTLRQWGQIWRNELALGLNRHDAVSRIEKQKRTLRQQLRVLIHKCISTLTRPKLAQCEINQSHPRLCHRFVITTVQTVRHLIRAVIG